MPLAAFNLAGRALSRAGATLPSLDEERIVARASRSAGSADFGTVEYLEPMRVLLRGLESEARLTTFGRLAARSHVATLLENRARMQDWWSRHPEMLGEAVVEPWFVVGLPRSGTTLLQQLLACDPANRTLRYWEAAHPTPPPERVSYETDPRIATARRAQRLLDYVAPDANAIHPVGAEAPTECVSLLAHSFASLELGVINHVPSHVAWCLRADLRPHYAYFRRQLQLLQWRCSATRWTLKSPAHLLALEVLFETFPDARVVWLHRDPLTAITSHCSLVAVLQAVGSDAVDFSAIGEEWVETWATVLEGAMSARSRLGEERFVDVAYEQFVADPMRELETIYAALGVTLDDETRSRMRVHLTEHPRDARGAHVYAPSDFGISAELLQHRCATYVARFPRAGGTEHV